MALFFLSLISAAYAHGHMKDPIPRQVMNKVDYNRRNPVGRSATCGRLYDSTRTNEFEVVKTLSPGQSFDVQLLLTANHIGKHWFEYACMDGMLDLPTSHSSVRWERLRIDSLNEKTETTESGADSCKDPRFLSGNVCTLKVRAPSATCNHGVLKWDWVAVHGSRSHPEIYKNCADVRIGTGVGSSVPPKTGTHPRPSTATATKGPTRPERPSTPASPKKSTKQRLCESNGCMNYCDMMTRSEAQSDDGMSSTAMGLIVGGVAVVALAAALTGYVFAKKRKEGRRTAGSKE